MTAATSTGRQETEENPASPMLQLGENGSQSDAAVWGGADVDDDEIELVNRRHVVARCRLYYYCTSIISVIMNNTRPQIFRASDFFK